MALGRELLVGCRVKSWITPPLSIWGYESQVVYRSKRTAFVCSETLVRREMRRC